MGFPTHNHRDIEIILCVLESALAHKDSFGTELVIRPGDVQVMSAGKGVRYSEFNHSKFERRAFPADLDSAGTQRNHPTLRAEIVS